MCHRRATLCISQILARFLAQLARVVAVYSGGRSQKPACSGQRRRAIVDLSDSVRSLTADIQRSEQSSLLERLSDEVDADLASLKLTKHRANGFSHRRKPRGKHRSAEDVIYNCAFVSSLNRPLGKPSAFKVSPLRVLSIDCRLFLWHHPIL
jgi:hypothetical protein